MEYTLKNGKTLTVRAPVPEDVGAMVDLRIAMDGETRFLGRNPGGFPRAFTVEKEAKTIRSMPDNPNLQWFVAECQGELVGRCAASVPSPRERFRHRGAVAFGVRKEYWGLGIGGKLMETCLQWCRERGCEQVELDVVTENERALGMYKRFGFEITGTRPRAIKYPDGSYADEYLMTKFF